MIASRRTFLRAGSAVLGLPWLESFARADDKTPPRRMVIVCTNFGLYGPSFFPEKSGADYAATEYTGILDGLRDRTTVFSGISHPDIGGDHASEACFLTSAKHPTQGGFRNTVSLDYLAARHAGSATRFPLLTLSTLDSSPLTHTASGAGVPALCKPSDVHARLFRAGRPDEVDRELARLVHDRSLLDRMHDRLQALRGRLGKADGAQLDDYAEAVREMEKQLQADEAWVKRPKPAAAEGSPPDNLERADTIGRARTLFTMAKLALQSDSTRIVTIFIRGMDLRPPVDGVTEDHHGASHHGRNPGKIEQLRKIERTLITAFRDFLASLQAVKEGGTTLLDSTQVLLGSNLGDASGHGTSNLPILLAGGGWKHGRHVAGDPKNNTPLGCLFVSMLRKFGVEAESFGSGKGPIDGLI